MRRALPLALLLACAKAAPDAVVTPVSTAASAAPSTSAAPATSAAADPSPRDRALEASPPAATVSESEALDALYPTGGAPADCMPEDRVRCLLGRLYAKDPAARALALDLYRDAGDVVGVEHDHTMNGGFRGILHLVPELPVATYRDKLAWTAAALRDFDVFFDGIRGDSGAVKYRWRALTVRFFRSVGRTTPSAYASPWTVSVNVDGSLLRTPDGLRETMFHEMFHMNDADHGDWSPKNLATDYDVIVKKCGTAVACLAPFAPNDTQVRGGTYYAFQPNNGLPVREYAAELALRFYKEQRAMLRHEGPPGGRSFKCGPPENARSWKALVSEFFGGLDLTPACP